MRIERFDPATDTAQVRACYEIYAAGLPVDDPVGPPTGPRVFAGWLPAGWSFAPRETWLVPGEGGDPPPAAYVLDLPVRQNTHLASAEIWVHPGQRRARLGTALLRHAADRARGARRRELTGATREGTAGAAFAAATGARVGLTEVRRVLHLADIPGGQLDRLRGRAQAAAAGYSLLTWTGATPEEYVDGAVAVDNAMADAPHSPGKEPHVNDAQHVRKSDDRAAVMGLRRYSVGVRHDASGELAGLTQLSVDPETPGWGFQELTAVTRPHRGHRLGLLIKVAMMDMLAVAEPGLERIVTGNAATNEHMIAINAELGFRVLDHWLSWQLDVSQVAAGPVASAAQA